MTTNETNESAGAMFNPSDRVKWLAGSPDGWAGPGIARVVGFDDKRRGFGPKGRPGPSFCIQLEHNRLDVWVFPHEIELAPEEQPAS